jgi:hypothetical protein
MKDNDESIRKFAFFDGSRLQAANSCSNGKLKRPSKSEHRFHGSLTCTRCPDCAGRWKARILGREVEADRLRPGTGRYDGTTKETGLMPEGKLKVSARVK